MTGWGALLLLVYGFLGLRKAHTRSTYTVAAAITALVLLGVAATSYRVL